MIKIILYLVASALSSSYALDTATQTVKRFNADQFEPLSSAVGELQLGAANSSNSWFSVREEANSLAWTRSPFAPGPKDSITTGKIESPEFQKWIARSVAINDSAMAAITASAFSASGSPVNTILFVDTTRSSFTLIKSGNFFAHWAKVDSRNRIWVVGWQTASIREEESGDFPLVRVYSPNGKELARGLPRSIVGEATAQRATNWAFTAVLGDEYLVQVRGHQQMHRLSLGDNDKVIKVTSFQGPAILAEPKSYATRVGECGSSLLLRWLNGNGGAGLAQRIGDAWTPVEVVQGSAPLSVFSFAGCTPEGKHKGLASNGNLVTLSPVDR